MPKTVEIAATVLPTWREDPVDATLTLGAESLVAATEDWTCEVPFPDVFDLRLGAPPYEVARAFEGQTLTVGVERDGEREVLFIDGDDGNIERFGRLLYRRLLNGREVAVRHPAEVGGRVTDRGFDIGEIQVGPSAVGFTGLQTPFVLDIESIIDFSRHEAELLGQEQLVIEIQYVRDGTVLTLELSLNPRRVQHLLGRYLRLEYDDIRRGLEGLDLPEGAGPLLVRLYARQGTASPTSLVEGPDGKDRLRELAASGLVTRGDDGVELTPRGWVLVTEQFGSAPPGGENSGPESVA